MAYFPPQIHSNPYAHFMPYYTQSHPMPFYAHNQLYAHHSIAANAAESAALQTQALEKARNLAQYVVPQNAPAIISTNNGKLVKRVLEEPYPPPVLRTQDHTAARVKADQLRESFPELMFMVKQVKNKEDLWAYFDGVDLWTQGITFLIDVVNEINRKNEIDDAKAKLIDEEAILWVRSQESQIWDAHKRNPGDTSSFFQAVEEAGMYDDCLPEERDLTRRALSYYRDLSLYRRQEQEQHGAQREAENQPVLRETKTLPATVNSSSPPNIHGESILHLIQPSVSVGSSRSTMQSKTVANRTNVHRVVPGSASPNPAISAYNNDGANSRPNILGARTAQTFGTTNGIYPGRSVLGLQSNRHRMGGPGRVELPGSNGLQRGERSVNGAPGPQERVDALNMAPPSLAASAASQPIDMLQPRQSRDQPQPDMQTHHLDFPQRSRSEPNPVHVISFFEDTAPTIPKGQMMSAESSPHSFASVIQIFKDNERAQVNLEKQTVTLCYNEPPLQNQHQHQSSRAVYIHGIEKALFIDDMLKAMMSLCGEVEKIHYMHSKQLGCFGTVFVTFVDETSPQRAIQRFNGHPLASGQILYVNYPRSKFNHMNDHSNYRRSSIHPRTFSEYSNLASTADIRRSGHPGQHDFSSCRQPHGTQGLRSFSAEYGETGDQLTIGFQSQLAPVTGWPTQPKGCSASMLTTIGTVPGGFVNATVLEALQRRSAIERFNQQQSVAVNARNGLGNKTGSSQMEINSGRMRRDAQRGPSSTGRGSYVKISKQQHPKNDKKGNCSLGPIAEPSVGSTASNSKLLNGVQRIAAKKKGNGEMKRGASQKAACPVLGSQPRMDEGKSKAQASDSTVMASTTEAVVSNLKASCMSIGGDSQMDHSLHGAPTTGSSYQIKSLRGEDEPRPSIEHKQPQEVKVKKNGKIKKAQNFSPFGSIVTNPSEVQAPARSKGSHAKRKPNATSSRSSNTDSRCPAEVSASSQAMDFTESSASKSSESSSGRGSDMIHNLSQASDTTNTTISHAETRRHNSPNAQNDSLVHSATNSKDSSLGSIKLPKLAADMEQIVFTEQQSWGVTQKGKSISVVTCSTSNGSTEEQSTKLHAKLDDCFEIPAFRPPPSPPSRVAGGKASATSVMPQPFAQHSPIRRNVVPVLPLARKRL